MIPNNKKVNTEQETQNNNISNKQDKLTAGDNITIIDNTISSNVEFLDYTTLSIPSNWGFADNNSNIIFKIGNIVFMRLSLNGTSSINASDLVNKGYLKFPSGWIPINNSRLFTSGSTSTDTSSFYEAYGNEIRLDGNSINTNGHFSILGIWRTK